MMEIRGEGEEERFLVKWKNWDGPASWIDTATNPELVAFVKKKLSQPSFLHTEQNVTKSTCNSCAGVSA